MATILSEAMELENESERKKLEEILEGCKKIWEKAKSRPLAEQGLVRSALLRTQARALVDTDFDRACELYKESFKYELHVPALAFITTLSVLRNSQHSEDFIIMQRYRLPELDGIVISAYVAAADDPKSIRRARDAINSGSYTIGLYYDNAKLRLREAEESQNYQEIKAFLDDAEISARYYALCSGPRLSAKYGDNARRLVFDVLCAKLRFMKLYGHEIPLGLALEIAEEFEEEILQEADGDSLYKLLMERLRTSGALKHKWLRRSVKKVIEAGRLLTRWGLIRSERPEILNKTTVPERANLQHEGLEALIERNKNEVKFFNLSGLIPGLVYLADFLMEPKYLVTGELANPENLGPIAPTFRSFADIINIIASKFLYFPYLYMKYKVERDGLWSYLTRHYELVWHDIAGAAMAFVPNILYASAFLGDLGTAQYDPTLVEYAGRFALLAPFIYLTNSLGALASARLTDYFKGNKLDDTIRVYSGACSEDEKKQLKLTIELNSKYWATFAVAKELEHGVFSHENLIFHTLRAIKCPEVYFSEVSRWFDRWGFVESYLASLYFVRSTSFRDLVTGACIGAILGRYDEAEMYAECAIQTHDNLELNILIAEIYGLKGDDDLCKKKWNQIIKDYVIPNKLQEPFGVDSKNEVSYIASPAGFSGVAIKEYTNPEEAKREMALNRFLQKKLSGTNFGISRSITTLSFEMDGETKHYGILHVIQGTSLENCDLKFQDHQNNIEFLALLNAVIPERFAKPSSDNIWDTIKSRMEATVGREQTEKLYSLTEELFKPLQEGHMAYKIDHNPRNVLKVHDKLYRIDTEWSRLTPLAVGLVDAIYMTDMGDEQRRKLVSHYIENYNHYARKNHAGKIIEDEESFHQQVLAGVVFRTLELYEPLLHRPRMHGLLQDLLGHSIHALEQLHEKEECYKPGQYQELKQELEKLRKNVRMSCSGQQTTTQTGQGQQMH